MDGGRRADSGDRHCDVGYARGVRGGARTGEVRQAGQVRTRAGGLAKRRYRARCRRQLAAQPVGYGLDGLATAQSAQDLLPLRVVREGADDRFVRGLLAAQLLDLVPEVLLGLSHRNLIVALDVLLGAAPATRLLAIALWGRIARVSLGGLGGLRRKDHTEGGKDRLGWE